ncbi:MAG: ABC transporter ATP-binding protein [Anaerolineae bacterium]|nr:ABC transporter ATP-binding protein [Anaerolineae bacterium]
MNDPILLTFKNIGFSYPTAEKPVFEQFNLDLSAGSVTAILGPNGAGKTTLLHLTLGWLKPQSGEILLEEQNLKAYSRRQLGQKMGLVPQSEHVAFEYSLLEYVMLGRAPYIAPLAMPDAVDNQVAMTALNRVGLDHIYRRSVLGLSGGELQLVLVARALAQQPRLLLLDEPTSHLDLANKIRLIHLLKELATQGVTILFTTHEPEIASALATHLVLMRQGQVFNSGTFSEVFTAQNLSALYNLPVEVVETNGKRVVLWT